MSMTRGEAIAELQACVDAWDRWVPANGSMADKNTQAVKMALSALRPVSREQVEKVRPGCGLCEGTKYVSGSASAFKSDDDQDEIETLDGDFDFCPACGRPLTNEAVQMVMERLEVLHETAK